MLVIVAGEMCTGPTESTQAICSHSCILKTYITKSVQYRRRLQWFQVAFPGWSLF